MRPFRTGFARLSFSLGLFALLAALLPGCLTDGQDAKHATMIDGPPPDAEILHVGDYLKIDFSGPEELKAVETKINDQGNITLLHIGDIKADGLKPRELEEVVRTNYVPQWYKALSVVVTPQSRSVTVGGDVKTPGSYGWISGMTVTKAIQAAGGFNEFGLKTKVRLRRANAKNDIIVNVKKAILNPEFDYPAYPGDSIMVLRRTY